jgi:phosphatidate phosphatase PAH1
MMLTRILLSIGVMLLLFVCEVPAAAAEDCSVSPQITAAGNWSRARKLQVRLWGHPHHRGIDLIAMQGAQQVLRGETHYAQSIRGTNIGDHLLEREAVDVYACRASTWTKIGNTETDGEGRFEMTLPKERQLETGLTQLYLSVVGDRSGAAFLALIAPPNTELVVSDVDGTLTESEDAFPRSLFNHAKVAANEGAAHSLQALRGRGYWIVYLTSRGQFFTEVTRKWLLDQHFPEGPLRLADRLVTLPGDETVAFKRDAMTSIIHDGLRIGIGNRRSDEQAYTAVQVPSTPIYIFRKEQKFFKEDGSARQPKERSRFHRLHFRRGDL